jgi:hypothetical protein
MATRACQPRSRAAGRPQRRLPSAAQLQPGRASFVACLWPQRRPLRVCYGSVRASTFLTRTLCNAVTLTTEPLNTQNMSRTCLLACYPLRPPKCITHGKEAVKAAAAQALIENSAAAPAVSAPLHCALPSAEPDHSARPLAASQQGWEHHPALGVLLTPLLAIKQLRCRGNARAAAARVRGRGCVIERAPVAVINSTACACTRRCSHRASVAAAGGAPPPPPRGGPPPPPPPTAPAGSRSTGVAARPSETDRETAGRETSPRPARR